VHHDRLRVQDLPDTEKAAKHVSSSELLDRIKELTDNGTFSVQFEMNKDVEALVVRVVDRDSGEVIRQVPSEDLLETIKALKDLRGLMIDAEF